MHQLLHVKCCRIFILAISISIAKSPNLISGHQIYTYYMYVNAKHVMIQVIVARRSVRYELQHMNRK